MSEILVRALTGAAFVATVVLAAWHSFYTFFALLFFASLMGLNEFLLMNKDRIAPRFRIPLLFLSGFLFFLFAYSFVFLREADTRVVLFSISAVLALAALVMIVSLFISDRRSDTIFGVIPQGMLYSTLFLSSWTLLYGSDLFGPWDEFYPLFLGTLILVWANDTFAYLSGRAFGRRKLLERISPKKTWEGTIGGALLCVASAYILSFFFPQLSALHWMGLALIVAPAATLGDLVESRMKRRAGVKDSGNVLPGHGGILDRFDATIIVSPIAVTYLFIVLGNK
ncbi:MAG: phosphatidate cytidylyltransferase [Bacteroidia bacterium]|nr:phosphatidate cytidylyltransferase [Bacteroidia bacterium]